MTVDKERLFKKLEHVGEYMVRENLENGVYGPNRHGLVEEWLEKFEENDEPEKILEEANDDADTLASEVREVPEGAPPRKWYQRLFGIR
ncbi:MAG: hypothetical protein HKN84_16090 [Gammaproteobacteria bacterium]|nr:hypothetical protein [Gammaproteobacteria bacterium]